MDIRHTRIRDAEKNYQIKESERLEHGGQHLVKLLIPIPSPGPNPRFIEHYGGPGGESGANDPDEIPGLKANPICGETRVGNLG